MKAINIKRVLLDVKEVNKLNESINKSFEKLSAVDKAFAEEIKMQINKNAELVINHSSISGFENMLNNLGCRTSLLLIEALLS